MRDPWEPPYEAPIMVSDDPCVKAAEAAAVLGRLGGKAGRGEAKRRGDSAYYKALRARDYVADRRQYLSNGKRNRTSGGWAVLRWDAARQIYVEPMTYYQTRREALEALRQS